MAWTDLASLAILMVAPVTFAELQGIYLDIETLTPYDLSHCDSVWF